MRNSEDGVDIEALVESVCAGEHRALARAISILEDRRPGYRELASGLHRHGGDGTVIGVTGSPGVGKSTLVDELAAAYREREETVGVIAIDPASPFTGGSVLGDRIRMADSAGDMDVFVRSMSARGAHGGLSSATAEAIAALKAFGKDRIIVETVGAGQNEIDVVRTADTVCVLLQPGSGDAVQTLKAGVLEIADVLVVNKADRSGVDQLVRDLTEMVEQSDVAGKHAIDGEEVDRRRENSEGVQATWTPPIVETTATDGEGIEELLAVLADHEQLLDRTNLGAETERIRYREAVRTILRTELDELVSAEIEASREFETDVEAIRRRETDPYAVAEKILDPIEDCFEERS